MNEIYTQCINNSKLLLAGIKLKGTSLFILTQLHVMKPYLNSIGINTDRVNKEKSKSLSALISPSLMGWASIGLSRLCRYN